MVRVQNFHQLIPRDPRALHINLGHHILIVSPFRFIVFQQTNARNAPELLPIARIIPLINGHKFFDALQPRQPHRCRDFVHLSVGSQVDDIVIPGKPEILHQPHPRIQVIIIGEDRAAFKGV